MRTVLIPSVPVANFEVVEVPVTANGLTRVAIPDQPMLRSYADGSKTVIVKSISLITAKMLSNAPLSGNTIAARAEIIKATLVLYVDGWERLHFIPLTFLIGEADADATTATTIPWNSNGAVNFDGVSNIDWTKSFIQYSTGLSSANSTYSFLFAVNYVCINKEGQTVKPL